MKTLKKPFFKNLDLPFANHLAYLVGAILLLTTACKELDLINPEEAGHAKDKATQATTHYGPAKPLGGGVARAWVKVYKNGEPSAIGVSLSEKALTNLPSGQDHGGHVAHETVLQLPKGVGQTPFTFVALYWNPQGHEPEHVYDKPHFDFHFYMISNELRQTIPGLPLTEFDPEPPAPQYIPDDYAIIPGRIPAMGSHFVDVTSPELNGGTFTETFIFGSYQRNVIFYEPMITLEYLLSKPQNTFAIKQPPAFQQAGYYPKNYRIEYDAKLKEHRVYLADLTHQQAQ